jgi:hypothetical protein
MRFLEFFKNDGALPGILSAPIRENDLRLNQQPYPRCLQERDKDPDAKIEVLGGRVTQRRGKMDPAAAETRVQRALLLHDLAGERAVKDGD